MNQLCCFPQILICAMPPLQEMREAQLVRPSAEESPDACADRRRTKIIVRVEVIARSQITEEATQPMITPM